MAERSKLILDRQSPRPPKAVIEQQMVEDIARIAQAQAVAVCEHYMAQVPALVAGMLAEGFAKAGLSVTPTETKPETVQ